jgi:hypothetical protein
MNVLPDPKYNPDLHGFVTSKTRLERGITMAKFLGAYGDKTSLNHITNESVRKRIARNLTLHARAINMVNGNTNRFNDVRIIVSEGIYNRQALSDFGSREMIEKAFGELVYYQVIDTDGKIDFEKTFDVAEYWKDHIKFKELVLDYDEYNTDGSLTAQIGLTMPIVPTSYDIIDSDFKQKINTVFNNNIFTKNELTEIIPR